MDNPHLSHTTAAPAPASPPRRKHHRPPAFPRSHYYTTPDLMRLFGRSTFAITQWARTKRIPAERVGHATNSRWYYPKRAIDHLSQDNPLINRADVYTTEQLTRILQLHTKTIQRWSRLGILPSLRSGHSLYYPKDQIDELRDHLITPRNSYTTAAVARLFGVSLATVRHWAHNGTLPAQRLQPHRRMLWYFPKQAVHTLLRHRSQINIADYYQTKDLMRRFRVTRAAVSLWALKGELPFIRRGKFFLFPKNHVERFRPQRLHSLKTKTPHPDHN